MNLLYLSSLPILLLALFFYENNWHSVNFGIDLPIIFALFFVLTVAWGKFFINRSQIMFRMPFSGVLAIILGVTFLDTLPGSEYLKYLLLLVFLISAVLYFDKELKITQVLCTIIIIGQILHIGAKQYAGNSIENEVLKKYEQYEVGHTFKNKYNIYYLVPDTYPSQQSTDIDGIDNSHMLDYLIKNGFSVDNHAYSNYPQTGSSMSATFNMQLLSNENHIRISQLRPYIVDMGTNLVTKTFIENGYNVNIKGHYIQDIDYQLINNKSDLVAFLRYIRLERLLDAIHMVQSHLAPQEKSKKYFYPKLSKINFETPLFVYLHSKKLHSYVFDCIDSSENFDNLEGFKQQINCVNNDLKQSIEYIRKNDPNGIIIIQADHGSNYSYRFTNENYNERITKFFGILFAIKWPDECKYLESEEISPVNLFPYVFACLSNTKPNYETMEPNNSFGMKSFIFHKAERYKEEIQVIKDNKIIAPKNMPPSSN